MHVTNKSKNNNKNIMEVLVTEAIFGHHCKYFFLLLYNFLIFDKKSCLCNLSVKNYYKGGFLCFVVSAAWNFSKLRLNARNAEHWHQEI